MPSVLIVSKDWTLRTAVRAELREAGLDARGMESLADAGEALAGGLAPSAVIFDAAMEETPAERAALANLARRIPLLVVASRVLPGADAADWLGLAAAVIYRPARVAEIVSRIKQLVQGQAA